MSGKVLYISHGGGPLPILGDKNHEKMVTFLNTYPSTIKTPDEILVISAHWEEAVPTIIDADAPPLLYDYSGFPDESYTVTYPARGNRALVTLIQEQLKIFGITSESSTKRGLDHGVFIPLLLMYPLASIPVTQLSLIKGLSPKEHLLLGEALSPLLERNILIIGSGSSFHNMGMFSFDENYQNDPLNNAFQDWLIEACSKTDSLQNRTSELEKWETAPGARYCHPREEHLIPLHVCAGLTGTKANVVFDDYIIGKRTVAFEW